MRRPASFSSGGRRGPGRSASPAPGDPGADPEVLVRACLERSPGAWESLIRQYANLIYSTVRRARLQEEDLEDAFQSTVLAIYTQLPSLRDGSRLAGWIIGIAHRQAINRVRARVRSRETPLQKEADGLERSAAIGQEDASPSDREREALERSQRLQEAMALLPDRCRRLLDLLFFQDPPLDYGEVARREGIAIGSIGPTRQRCLERLRGIYESRGWTSERGDS